jgi:8-oxo-dGTP diphosphatase
MERSFGNKVKSFDYRPRQAVYAIIFNENKEEIVSVQTPDGFYWLPGGGVEGDESHHDCLKREMLEETGYEVEITGFIGKAKQFFSPSENEHIVNEGNFYIANLLLKVSEPMEDDHKLKWIAVKNVEKLLYHQHQSWAVNEGIRLLKAGRIK